MDNMTNKKNTNKQLKVYVDVDNTIIKSSNAMARWYNKRYKNHPDFKKANGRNVYYFNATNEMPLLKMKDIEELFSCKSFWEEIEIYENCIETLKKLTDTGKYIFTFCSIGTSKNIANKTLFLEDKFPFVKQHEMLVKNFGAETRMGKDKFVQDGLLIDDHQENLNGSAMYEILFMGEGIKNWNKDWSDNFNKKGKTIVKGICSNWKDMYYMIEEIYNL